MFGTQMHYITIDLNFAKCNYYVYDGIIIAKYKAFMSYNEAMARKGGTLGLFSECPRATIQ